MLRHLNNLTIKNKFLIGFIIVVVIGLTGIGWNIFNIKQMHADILDIAREAEDVVFVNDLQVYLLEQEIAEKEFLLTGDNDRVLKHQELASITDHYFELAIADASSGEAKMIERAVEFKDAYEKGFEQVVSLYDGLEPDGLSMEVGDKAVEQVHLQAQAIVEKEEKQVRQEVDEAAIEARNAVDTSIATISLFTVLSVVIGVGIYNLSAQIVKPLFILTQVAASVEAGNYDLGGLNEVTGRQDELGQLSRVFQHMIQQVRAREEALKQELVQLRIEIDRAKQTDEVKKITGSERFAELKRQAKQIRDQNQQAEE